LHESSLKGICFLNLSDLLNSDESVDVLLWVCRLCGISQFIVVVCSSSVGSLEDVNLPAVHTDTRGLAADWNVHADEIDSIYLEKYLPMTRVMSPWLSPRDCDAVLDGKLDAVYCRGPQCGMAYQQAMYVDCCHDQYHLPHCCIDCSSQGFINSATDSPNVGRGVSGELPGAARRALYFATSPAEDRDPYTLLT